MGILGIVSAILKLILMFFTNKLERDKERKRQLEEARKEVKDGIKNKDRGAILRGFNRAKRVRGK